MRLLTLLPLLALGCGSPAPPVDLERGKAHYLKLCASCHGVDGRAKTPVAAMLKPPPRDFSEPWKHGVSDAEVKRNVLRGIPGTAMPGLESAIPPDAVDDVVAYVKTLMTSR